jgi:hypothetical protein
MGNRHKRHKPSLCVACADHSERHKRHTPLGGVTTVTVVDMVPMPLFLSAGGVAGGGYAFALCNLTAKVFIYHRTYNRSGYGSYRPSSHRKVVAKLDEFNRAILRVVLCSKVKFSLSERICLSPFFRSTIYSGRKRTPKNYARYTRQMFVKVCFPSDWGNFPFATISIECLAICHNAPFVWPYPIRWKLA